MDVIVSYHRRWMYMYRYIIWKYNIYYICNGKIIFSLLNSCNTCSRGIQFIHLFIYFNFAKNYTYTFYFTQQKLFVSKQDTVCNKYFKWKNKLLKF